MPGLRSADRYDPAADRKDVTGSAGFALRYSGSSGAGRPNDHRGRGSSPLPAGNVPENGACDWPGQYLFFWIPLALATLQAHDGCIQATHRETAHRDAPAKFLPGAARSLRQSRQQHWRCDAENEKDVDPIVRLTGDRIPSGWRPPPGPPPR